MGLSLIMTLIFAFGLACAGQAGDPGETGHPQARRHGRGGADFCDLTDEAFAKIGRGKLADGVTGFLATGLTRPESDLVELCRAAEGYKAKGEGAT